MSTTVRLLADWKFSGVQYRSGDLVTIPDGEVTALVAAKIADNAAAATARALAEGSQPKDPTTDINISLLNKNEKNAKLTDGVLLTNLANGTNDLFGSAPGAGMTISNSPGGGVRMSQASGKSIVSTITFNVTPYLLELDTTIHVVARLNTILGCEGFNVYTTTQASNFAGFLNYSGGNTPLNMDTPFNGGLGVFTVTGAELDAAPHGDLSIRAGTSTIDRMRLSITMTEGSIIDVVGVYINTVTKPMVSIVWDDCEFSAYQEAYNYMLKKGILGTFAVNSSTIGLANKMTLANLQEAYNAGWDLINHSSTHDALMSGYQASGTVDGPLNQICLSQTVTAGNSFTLNGSIAGGLFDKPRHVVFKSASTDNHRRFLVSGINADTGSADSQLCYGRTGQAWLGGEKVWSQITSIVAVDGTAGAVTVGVSYSYSEVYNYIKIGKDYLLKNGFTRGSDIFISANGQVTPLVIRALNDLGYTKHRGTRTNQMQPFLAPTPFGIPSAGNGITNGGSATSIAYADKAVLRWSPITFYFHKVVPDSNAAPATTEARVSDMRLFIDAIDTYIKAGKLICPTLSEFCRLCGY
jgi:hypothetical protein